MSEELQVSVDYQPADTGPFLWQAFDLATITSDLAAIAAAGFRVVRIGLAWDSFMPDARGVDPRRLSELGSLLTAAQVGGLRIIPVLFVQAHGDCLLLPGRAVLRSRARRGVRILADGLQEPGGPRDPWTDPLMLELADRWSRAMAGAFAGHPAIAAWDLGDDPASVARPRRSADMGAWARLVAEPLRSRGDTVQMTFGAGDVSLARGVRLAPLAAQLDRLQISVRPAQLRRLRLPEAAGLCFIAQLAQSLAAVPSCPVGLTVSLPSVRDDAEGIEENAAPTVITNLVERLRDAGISGLIANRWTDLRPRLGERAPYDRARWLLHAGLVRDDGSAKPLLAAWSGVAGAGLEAPSGAPWPSRLDVEAFYADLPDSLLDLAASWHREHDGHPAILDRSEE
ncbi:MAG TPA: hypothetical protein VEK76_13965 [Candidatus Binatia bacterium]|nr:hypothetical protein [Candidatus Binatia bacterium]